jgi:4-amino-4-deoxy-L-arabinose transferase-like glycosyltransferase
MSTSDAAPGLSVARAVIIVLAVWGALYLPGLGTLEIKGEEGRRILPAIRMLETGDYVVPYVGSTPYLRKPPLVNWLVAASFEVFGARNEWTARLPSTVAVLAVALAFVAVARRSLGAAGSLIGALVWLTCVGMLEKGRLIEIEAIYVSLTGLAIVCWLSWWQERRSAWLTWTVPWFFLGLALLAKGPLHLLFFYAIVGAVLWRSRELRRLLHPAHALGLVLMLALFACWAIPYLRATAESGAAYEWSRQFTGRLTTEDFHLRGWLSNIPRGLVYFLLWTPLLLFVRGADFGPPPRSQIASALQWAMAVTFLGVSVLPGSLPRYTMPLLVPAAWLIAMLLTAERSRLQPWLRKIGPVSVAPALRLPALVTGLACISIGVYAFGIMPHLLKRDDVRPLGAQINAALPAGEPLYAINPDYQPFLFYVRDPIVYVSDVSQAPASARFLLVQPMNEQEVLATTRWLPRRPRELLRFRDYRKRDAALLEVVESGAR